MDISFNDIKQKFQGCGLKTTPQRTAIYDALLRSTAHPTAEDLFAQVAPQFPMMSLNTVYYTLGVLRTSGLIHEGLDSTHKCNLNSWLGGAAAITSWPCLTDQSKRSTHERLYAADPRTTISNSCPRENGPESNPNGDGCRSTCLLYTSD